MTGDVIKRQSPQEISDQMMMFAAGTRLMLLAPLEWKNEDELPSLLQRIRREGFVRVRKDGEMMELEQLKEKSSKEIKCLEIVVDRLILQEGGEERLRDSLETTLRWGKNTILVLAQEPGRSDWEEHLFSTDFCNPKTGFTMESLTPKHFSFNSPKGACQSCDGLGKAAEKSVTSVMVNDYALKF